ncbi:hypothetical protein CCR75_000273 [Bremia lactucae]|uniref:DnaJ homologue subfamily C GRV2/DNAJC13 N-terminal domain-containing protein n=1 Tax=Bremia lactucae TaxID=4779 RepID=A0A976FLX6_BRELC|nr:hypothetical protein CCR75_000273 [Bremia lactucae]
MGQAGSVQQKSALRDVLMLRHSNVSNTELEEVLRTFCAVFPLELTVSHSATFQLQMPDNANHFNNVVSVDIKERRLFDVVYGLLQDETEQAQRIHEHFMTDLFLRSFRRVIRWRELYKLCAKCSMKPFLTYLRHSSSVIVLSVLETLLLMVSPCPGFEIGDKASNRSEAANRKKFGEVGGFGVLQSLLVQYGVVVVKQVQTESAVKVVAGVLKLFHVTLTLRRKTTDLLTCTQAVEALMNARVSLLGLCHCSDGEYEVMRLAVALVKELCRRSNRDQFHKVQESAREYGALLYVLEMAVGEDEDKKNHDMALVEIRDLSADLVEVFCCGNMRSKRIMFRIIPEEFFNIRQSTADQLAQQTKLIPEANVTSMALPRLLFKYDQQMRTSMASSTLSMKIPDAEPQQKDLEVSSYNALHSSGAAFRYWIRGTHEPWRELIKAIRLTFLSPRLVWRSSMRNELRQALRMEIKTLESRRQDLVDKGMVHSCEDMPRWDDEMFHVEYPSMYNELLVNGYYLTYLIPYIANSSAPHEIADPLTLVWHLADRLVVEHDEKWAQLCLQCLRLIITRHPTRFTSELPTQYVLSVLRNHANHSPAFLRECFRYLNTAIMLTYKAPSKFFCRNCTSVARSILQVLADPNLAAPIVGPLEVERDAAEDTLHFVEPEDDRIAIVNERDGLIRAGMSLLLNVIRQGKFVLQLVKSKRIFLCRLLAVKTLDHVTITQILFLLQQLALLDGTTKHSSTMDPHELSLLLSLSSSSNSAQSRSSTDSNWRALALVCVLLASCDPNSMGMCVAGAKFLQECCVMSSKISTVGDAIPTSLFQEVNDLLNEALGCGGCGIGRLLFSTNADEFVNTFNAHETRAADVKWGHIQRVRLFRYLEHKYFNSGNLPESNSSSHGVNDGVDQLYEDEELYIGNIFLRSYIEDGGKFLCEWTQEMYSESITALFEELAKHGCKSAYCTESGSACLLPLPPHPSSLIDTSDRNASCPANSWEIQVLILKALARLVPLYGAPVKIKSESYINLVAPLRWPMLSKIDQERGILSLELLIAVLSFSEARSVNTAACHLFLEKKGLSVLADALTCMDAPSFQQMLQNKELFDSSNRNMARMLLYRSIDLLSILAKQQAGIRAITANPDVVAALIELSSNPIIKQCADIDAVTVCLSALGGLCQFNEICTLVVNAGGLLSLLDIVVSCPAELIDEEPAIEQHKSSELDASDPQSRCKEDNSAKALIVANQSSHDDNCNRFPIEKAEKRKDHLRLPSRFYGAVRSAALVLRTCLGPKDTEVPSISNQVLSQLLTPSFIREETNVKLWALVQVLRASPDQFVLEMQTTEDINSATLVWTVSMRQRLQTCIAMELAKVRVAANAKTWPRWNPEQFIAPASFRYQYSELADVLVLHDIYLANFVAARAEDLNIEVIDVAAFSEALLISVQSFENVLRILHERGLSDSRQEAVLRLMRQALNKLVSKHPQHNLEVEFNCNDPLSRDSAFMSPAHSCDTLVATVHSFLPTDDRDWDITQIERCSSSGIEDLTV